MKELGQLDPVMTAEILSARNEYAMEVDLAYNAYKAELAAANAEHEALTAPFDSAYGLRAKTAFEAYNARRCRAYRDYVSRLEGDAEEPKK
jgi:hypothetical protein